MFFADFAINHIRQCVSGDLNLSDTLSLNFMKINALLHRAKIPVSSF